MSQSVLSFVFLGLLSIEIKALTLGSFLLFPFLDPITSLSLVNYTEKEVIPAGFDLNILEVTPQGKLANLNRKNKGNEMYLLYRGGAASPFGYDKRKYT